MHNSTKVAAAVVAVVALGKVEVVGKVVVSHLVVTRIPCSRWRRTGRWTVVRCNELRNF